VETLARPTVDRIFGPLAALVPLHTRVLAVIKPSAEAKEESKEEIKDDEEGEPSAEGGGGGVEEETNGSTSSASNKKVVARNDVQSLWKEIGERVKDYKQFIIDCGPAMFELKRALANNSAFASFCATNEGLAKVPITDVLRCVCVCTL
jgi:hypothetical protein